jgi:hypothetical protein
MPILARELKQLELDWESAILAALFGLSIVYLLPWLIRFAPSDIRVTDAQIVRVIADRPVDWQFENIRMCRVVTQSISGDEIRVLELTGNDGRNSILGIADTVDLNELEKLLSEGGVTVSREEKVVDSAGETQ